MLLKSRLVAARELHLLQPPRGLKVNHLELCPCWFSPGAGAVLTSAPSPRSAVPALPARNPSSFPHDLQLPENLVLILHVVPEG